MATILDKIAAYKREEVARARKAMALSELDRQARAASPVRGFAKALDAWRTGTTSTGLKVAEAT